MLPRFHDFVRFFIARLQIVCNNIKGGGWFQEGVSNESAEILRSLYSPHLSEFDFACLAWWARNRIFIEQKLSSVPNLTLIKYEDMVTDPKEFFGRLTKFIGLRSYEKAHRYFHQRSILKNTYPEMSPVVRELCEDLMVELNNSASKFEKSD